MKLRSTIAIVVLGGFCLLAGIARAQSPTTGQITGVVRDASGAVVSDAKVTLTSAAGVQREGASDANGHFTFALLPPGAYRVEVEKAGFSKATAEGAVVRITETTSLEIHVAVATQKAVIEVQAETPLVQTVEYPRALLHRVSRRYRRTTVRRTHGLQRLVRGIPRRSVAHLRRPQ